MDSKSITLKSLDKVIRYKFIDSDGDQSKEFIRKGIFHIFCDFL